MLNKLQISYLKEEKAEQEKVGDPSDMLETISVQTSQNKQVKNDHQGDSSCLSATHTVVIIESENGEHTSLSGVFKE